MTETAMFGLFKKRNPDAENHAEFVATMQLIVVIPLQMAGKKPTDALTDFWAIGYIYGASIAVLGKRGIEGDGLMPYLIAAYGSIFETEAKGKAVIQFSIKASGEDAKFDAGVNDGIEDVDKWNNVHIPIKLAFHFQKSA